MLFKVLKSTLKIEQQKSTPHVAKEMPTDRLNVTAVR